jgi:hypothetical protein
VVTDHPGNPEAGAMNQQSTLSSGYRIVVRERVGEYVLTAFERPELEPNAASPVSFEAEGKR